MVVTVTIAVCSCMTCTSECKLSNDPKAKCNPSKYCQTIKPFMTDKSKVAEHNIVFCHDNKVIEDPAKVCNIFN